MTRIIITSLLAITTACGGSATDSATTDGGATDSGASLEVGAAQPAGLSPIDLDPVDAAAGTRLPGLLVSVYACTGATPSSDGECYPVPWAIVDGLVYPQPTHHSYRLWVLR